MARSSGLIMGIVALAIPVLITIMIYAWDAYLWVFVLPGIPLSLILLIGCFVTRWGARQRDDASPFWVAPVWFTMLTILAYGVAIAKLATMPIPP